MYLESRLLSAKYTYQNHKSPRQEVPSLPWDIENYYIINNRVLTVEFSIPLREFLKSNIDDVKTAWLEMLNQFVAEQPGYDMSWEMTPRNDDALVTVKIAKIGELADFTSREAEAAISAADAMFDKQIS